MNIKTVTTVSGVNAVDFGAAASRFFWFRNIGTDAVYVSGNADITAGGDGVAELAVGNSVCVEALGGKIYVLGAGKVEIYNTGDKFCPFKIAPVAGGGGGEVTVDEWIYTSPDDPGGLLANIMNTTEYNGGGYNISGGIQGRFGFYQSLSGYNITHSNLTDMTNVKRITINGATVANKDGLSATAYYCISDETITELDERWTEIHSSSGTSISNFSAEIDCSEITGEKSLYLAIEHGGEISGYTSYFYVDKITLSDVSNNVNYADNAGNADTVDGFHADNFFQKAFSIEQSSGFTSIPTITDENGLLIYREFINKSTDASTTAKYWRLYVPNGSKYSDIRATATDAGVTWNITGTAASHILKVNDKKVLTEGESYGKQESGAISGLANSTAQSVSLSFTPSAVLIFNGGNLIVSGYSISLGTNKFTITPSSVSEMGTNVIRYIALGG